ncbi:MAG: SDR family oxidoreductase [Anaerolineae bacterium]|nr:SDR family oxidoreductase [Anaerolineae bacterium]
MSLSRTAAIECAEYNIRVNSISPDAVTDVFELLPDDLKIQIARAYPLKRASSPDDIARAVLYLCSDDATSVTGHNLVIDGGYSGH